MLRDIKTIWLRRLVLALLAPVMFVLLLLFGLLVAVVNGAIAAAVSAHEDLTEAASFTFVEYPKLVVGAWNTR